LAVAGLKRLDLQQYISDYLSFDTMLPAPGQAALAVQCRADDDWIKSVLQAIDHVPTRAAVTAERTFLSALGGGCSAPVAAYAEAGNLGLRLTGLVASLDGKQVVRIAKEGGEPVLLATEAAQQAKLSGAQALLL
jgi:hydroxymethylbilane synthase